MRKYLLLVSLIFTSACHKSSSGGASVSDAFANYISPDTQTLVAVHLDQLKTSPLYQRHEAEFNVPRLNDLATRVGLDPRRDLSDVMITWNGKEPLLLAKGSFSKDQLAQKLTQNGAIQSAYKGTTILAHDTEAVAFTSSNIAIAGTAATVRAALDHPGTMPDELQQRLSEVPADSQIILVSRGGLPLSNFALNPNISSALSNLASSVSGVALGMHIDAGLKLDTRAICVSAEAAQRVNDTIRGLIGFARLSTKDNELDLLRMWDAFSISKDNQTVRIQADLAPDLTEKLLTQLRTRQLP